MIVLTQPASRAIHIVRTLLELRYGAPVEFKKIAADDKAHSHYRNRRCVSFRCPYGFIAAKAVSLVPRPEAAGCLVIRRDRTLRKWVVDDDASTLFDCGIRMRFIRQKTAPQPYHVDEYCIPAFRPSHVHACGSSLKDRRLDDLSSD